MGCIVAKVFCLEVKVRIIVAQGFAKFAKAGFGFREGPEIFARNAVFGAAQGQGFS
jgi:hypothetical protein